MISSPGLRMQMDTPRFLEPVVIGWTKRLTKPPIFRYSGASNTVIHFLFSIRTSPSVRISWDNKDDFIYTHKFRKYGRESFRERRRGHPSQDSPAVPFGNYSLLSSWLSISCSRDSRNFSCSVRDWICPRRKAASWACVGADGAVGTGGGA